MPDALTVGAVLANAARACPDRIAAVVGDVPATFAELDAAGDAIASQLVADGFGTGDLALVCSETSFELLAHFVGCARAGVVFAPVQPAIDSASLASIAQTLEPAVALCSAGNEAVAAAVDVPCRWFDITAGAAEGVGAEVGGDSPHIVYLTSGSTGTPKGVLLSHRTSVLRSHPGSQLERRGAALCPYPLFHMAGWTISLQQWHARASVVFVEGTGADVLTDALQRHDIERFNAVPALWIRLAEYLGERRGDAFPRLRFADTGTSPTSVELLRAIGEMAPAAQVRVFYGSSEAGNVTSLGHDEVLARPGSCGVPSVLTEVALGDDDELLVRGPLLFDGYVGQPELTDAALRDGWFHTGDIASIDDGYVSIRGRLGNVIRTGGEAVDPTVVEAALATHESIEQVAVFGLADEQWGEVVVAAVVSGDDLTIDDLRSHLGPDGAQPLAPHHHPRRMLVLDELPRTPATQQINRRALRELAVHGGEEPTDVVGR